jgi:putative flavoprotein involved in K+ transport
VDRPGYPLPPDGDVTTDGTDVVIVGAGQAGLSVATVLADRGVDHLVLERDRLGSSWASRWDSFCLVTPNWAIEFPDAGYDGDDPDGFMPKDEVVRFLERFANRGGLAVRTGVEVESIRKDAGLFTLQTSGGELSARVVVACTGAYQRAHRPGGAASVPKQLPALDADEYRNPSGLPSGGVLIVGSGQTGCQIAEELHEAGRDVVLACGRAPWVPRRLGGRDIVWWARETGFLDQPAGSLPDPAERLVANLLNTGHGGGHDLHYRTLQGMGVTLAGHFERVEGRTIRFADDLAACVAWGDARRDLFMGLVGATCERTDIEPPAGIDGPPPFRADAPTKLPLDRFGSVIFAGGFRPNYGSWIPWTHAFDADGFPLQLDGASSVIDGLFFAGVHFLRKRKSSLLYGVGEDAALVAERIAALGG